MLEKQYKNSLSGFYTWSQRLHASDYVLFKANLKQYVSIDETCLSRGEVYTIVTSKEAGGRKGCLVAMIKGTSAEAVVPVLRKLSAGKRAAVKEITLDLSSSMQAICKRCFPGAVQVSDRFHVQKLMSEAVDNLRIKHRWEVIDQENKEKQLAREVGKTFRIHKMKNGDTPKKLMFYSKRLLFKHHSKWTPNQRERAEILFEQYPDMKEAYDRYIELVEIYNKRHKKEVAATKLARWYDKVEKMEMRYFKTVVETLQENYLSILNYFERRSTNAAAESFNAKVKAFRNQFRGVQDIPFFIFRLTNIFA